MSVLDYRQTENKKSLETLALARASGFQRMPKVALKKLSRRIN